MEGGEGDDVEIGEWGEEDEEYLSGGDEDENEDDCGVSDLAFSLSPRAFKMLTCGLIL